MAGSRSKQGASASKESAETAPADDAKSGAGDDTQATTKSTAQSAAESGSESGSATETGDKSTRSRSRGVTGPGTGAASPDDEQDRMPSTMVVPSEAGPLVPTDVQKVHEPLDGHKESSTNSVAANAAQRSVPGSNHIRLHNEAGDEVSVDDLFDGPEGASRMVTVRERVYQTFTYPHAKTPTTQLLWPKGAVLPLAEAERFKAATKTYQGLMASG